LVRRARAGCLAADGLCRTCAACHEPADQPPSRHAAPIVRRVVPSQELEAGYLAPDGLCRTCTAYRAVGYARTPIDVIRWLLCRFRG
jgi:hypothetical protein